MTGAPFLPFWDSVLYFKFAFLFYFCFAFCLVFYCYMTFWIVLFSNIIISFCFLLFVFSFSCCCSFHCLDVVVAATVVVIELAVVVDSHLYSMYAGKGGGLTKSIHLLFWWRHCFVKMHTKEGGGFKLNTWFI